MKTKRRYGFLTWMLAAACLLMIRPAPARAADDPTTQMSLSLNAGETYVIDNVSPGDAPSITVIDNPHALIVHNEEPGKVTLLGAEKGRWAVKVKLASGDAVTYDVVVRAVANNLDINNPGASPAAISGSGVKSGTAAPVAAKPEDVATSVVPAGTEVASATPAASADLTAPVAVAAAASAPVAAASAPVADATIPAPTPKASAPVVVAGGAMGMPTTPTPFSAPAPYPSTPTAGPAPEGVPAMPLIPSQAPPPLRQQMAPAGSGAYSSDPSVLDTTGRYHSDSISGGTHYLPEDVVLLMTGTSRIIDFPSKLRRVSIADTGIADIQVVNPYQINLIGHKPGFTTLAVWNTQGHYEERQVRIDPNGKQQVLLNTIVAELDRSNLENQGANFAAALSHAGVSLVGLPGSVATPFSPSTSVTSPSGVVTQANNSLEAGGSLTGLILSPNIVYGLAAGNSNYQTQILFNYLETHGLAKILAQPRLLANSGEQAKFLSGGEIPIVIAQALNTSIVFKQFGTSVEFVPTVVGLNDIELLVKPEVSEPDPTQGVQLFGFTVPAFITRRAETVVRLRDDQTLIIAGLILHEKKTQIQKVPYLGDIPYVGAFFRNTTYNNTETDLMMSVTPQIVAPLPEGGQPYNPYDTPQMTSQQIETRRLAQPDVTRPRF